MSELQPADAPTPAAAAPAPRWLPWSVATIVIATLLGAALSPYLAVHHPLWLIALNPWPRHQILVAPHVPFPTFVVLVSIRGLASCLVAYELGKHYGVRGTEFIAGRSPDTGRMLRVFEQLFARFSGLLLMLVPGLLTSALAGMSGTARLSALVLSMVGLCFWASVNHHLGGVLAPWTAPLLSFVREHVLAATLICVLAVLIHQMWMRARKRVRVHHSGDVEPSDRVQ